jgi:hypothetical protein
MKPALAVGVLVVAVLPSVAVAQVPAGGEFRVNSYTTSNQNDVAIAVAPQGRFVVVWASYGGTYGVYGQRFDEAGQPLGPEFLINTYITNDQRHPAVAMDAAGNFVVVWVSEGQDGSLAGVFGQRFDAEGARLGGEFRVNTYTTDEQRYPAVAMDPVGNFVVVWASFAPQDGSFSAVFGQRHDAAGVRQGGEFQVNTYTTSFQSRPRVAMDAVGNFVVAWESSGQDGYFGAVLGQRYDAAGAPRGSEFQVNTYTTHDQYAAVVVMDAVGNFVVAWTSGKGDGYGRGVFGQRYDAAGARQGEEFQVNTYTTDDQRRPAVSMDAVGNFVVVWRSLTQDGDSYGIFGQRYDAAGAPRGSEFQVNTYTTNHQSYPAVGSDAAGNFVVVWQSLTQDGSGDGIFGRRYGGLLPAALAVDASGNGVLEPGESVTVTPAWRNISGAPLAFTGDASNFDGPPGATYTLVDPAATYEAVANAATGACLDCYRVAVSRPATRPTPHWDVTVRETIGPSALGQTTVWTLHVGESFADVPPAHPFYRFIETLFHVGVTAGCTATTYCPDGVTTREQMAVFLLRAREGGGYTPPPCTAAPFPDVPCSSPFAPWVRELVARGITAGCGGGLYCPTSPVTREQMAVFLLKTHDGAAFVPPACTTATFSDVPCASPFAAWVQELVARGITAGCGGGLYCPSNPVTRGQMAVFLTKTFALTLHGP